MNKKLIIFILIVVFIIIGFVFIINRKEEVQNYEENNEVNLVQNEGGYYVFEKDGEIEFYTDSESDAQWYQTHQDYNPEPVHFEEEGSTNQVDYDFSEENVEQ